MKVKIIPMWKSQLYAMRTRLLKAVLPKRFHVSDCFLTAAQSDFQNTAVFRTALAAAKQAFEQDGLFYEPVWRLHVQLWAARQARTGILVECGVNKGATGAGILAAYGHNIRRMYLCDCWEFDDYTGTFEGVQQTFRRYPQVRFVKGYMPDAAAEIQDQDISFLHLDMNDGEVEVETLRRLWAQLVPGAIVLLDDYAFPGFVECEKPWRMAGYNILSLPTGQGLLIK